MVAVEINLLFVCLFVLLCKWKNYELKFSTEILRVWFDAYYYLTNLIVNLLRVTYLFLSVFWSSDASDLLHSFIYLQELWQS